jgi:hypothetical protein
VIVPVDKSEEIADGLWRVLERFDPDRLGVYIPTRRAQQLAHPDLFEEWLQKQAAAWAEQSDAMTVAEARKQLLESSVLDSPLVDWRPGSSLEEQVRTRLAPLDNDHPFDHVWTADSPPSRDILDITNVDETLGSAHTWSIRASDIDPHLDLMLTTRLGAFQPALQSWLAGEGIAAIEVQGTAEHLSQLVEICWERDVRQLRRSAEFIRDVGEGPPLPWSDEAYENTPFSLTTVGCSAYVMGRPWRGTLPNFVVVGDSAEDYSLAMLLDRMYHQSYWCPVKFLRGSDDVSMAVRSGLARQLHKATGYGRGDDERILLTSMSLSLSELDDIPAVLDQDVMVGHGLVSSLDLMSPNDLPLHTPVRLYDKEQVRRQRYEPFQGAEMAGTLDTPKPSSITPVVPIEFTWHVDALVDEFKFPPRSALSSMVAVYGVADADSVRASSDGISYHSREPFFIAAGASLDQMLYRPRLRRPDATSLFQALLMAAGLTGSVSQAGRYTEGILSLWGGLQALAADLSHPQRYALLEAYRKESPSGEDPGVWIEQARRRYLSFWHARRATGLPRDELRVLLDEYVERGILSRGLCLKCSRCHFASWYAMEEVGQGFHCSRCRAESPITQSTWRQPSEPTWFYQLDEIAFQAIAHNARAPVLALAKLRTESRSFDFSAEMDVFDGEKLIAEVDLLAFIEGAIVVGEAKSTDHLDGSESQERTIARRLYRVAAALTADELLLATTHLNWSRRTLKVMSDEVKDRVRLRFLTNLQ